MKTFKTLLATALVATTLMAAAPVDALGIHDAYVEVDYNHTVVHVVMTEPFEADTVLVEIFVNGELWKFQTWYTYNRQFLEIVFDGKPPAGELTISVTPL